MNNEEFQKIVLEKFDKLDDDIKILKDDSKELKKGQKIIKDQIRDLEFNNVNRH